MRLNIKVFGGPNIRFTCPIYHNDMRVNLTPVGQINDRNYVSHLKFYLLRECLMSSRALLYIPCSSLLAIVHEYCGKMYFFLILF